MLKRKNIQALLIIAFLAHIAFFLYDSFSNNVDVYNTNPWTFYWVWLIGAFILGFISLMKLDINVVNFFIGLILIPICMTLGSLLLFVSPNLSINYVGVKIANDVDYSEYSVEIERMEDKFFWNRELISKPEFEREVNSENKKKQFYEFFEKESFSFWQTAIVKGYAYKQPKNFTEKMELYFTVGPVVLIELFLSSLRTFIVLFLFNLVWYKSHKRNYLFQDNVV